MNTTVDDVLRGKARACVVRRDCMQVMQELSGGSVHVVADDPPYGSGNWEREESGAGSSPVAVHNVEEWDVWDARWIDEALRIASGQVLTYLPNTRVEELLRFGREKQLPTRLLFWAKTDPRPRFIGQPAFGFEPIIAYRALVGGDKDWFHASAPRKNRDADGTGHPHQKSVKVDMWLLRLCGLKPNSVVFVPHGGSGTAAVAALSLGHRVIICEMLNEWADKAEERIALVETGASWKAPEQLGLGDMK